MTTTSIAPVTTSPAVSTFEAEQPTGLPTLNPFSVLIGVIAERVMALMGLVAESAGSMEESTNAELSAQKMSNETNEALTNVQNSINNGGDPNQTVSLPEDVVDYINDNQIVISGVTENSDGSFKSISTSDQFNAGQLEAVKGQMDIEATQYADSSSQTQMTIQEVAQAFSMSISEISQLMSKSNQVATTIVNNLK